MPSPAAAASGRWLFVTLVMTIGLPFFALSTSAAVLQKWYSITDDEGASDPYFLYAASNLGSVAALLAYPTLIEPSLRLQEQVRWWALGYVTLAVLVAICAVSCGARRAHRSRRRRRRQTRCSPGAGARAGRRSRSSRRACSSASRPTSLRTSRLFPCYGSCRSRCTC